MGEILIGGTAALLIEGSICIVMALPIFLALSSCGGAAAWLALWQFLTDPYYWNKTEHGLSSLQKRRTGK